MSDQILEEMNVATIDLLDQLIVKSVIRAWYGDENHNYPGPQRLQVSHIGHLTALMRDLTPIDHPYRETEITGRLVGHRARKMGLAIVKKRMGNVIVWDKDLIYSLAEVYGVTDYMATLAAEWSEEKKG